MSFSEHLKMRRLLEGGFYFIFPIPNAALIGGRRLKEEIQYLLSFITIIISLSIFGSKIF